MTLDLTVAIPSHNDNGHLTRLLSHLAALKFTRSIIVVDDGSLPAPDHDTLIKASGLAPAQLTLLRQPQVAGAGAARALGAARAAALPPRQPLARRRGRRSFAG
ncbi:MAG: glycosyltransferase, partial [Pseudomonadota bacterium]|nr:glycosyltransferase [Pseudomonadota bacterium]